MHEDFTSSFKTHQVDGNRLADKFCTTICQKHQMQSFYRKIDCKRVGIRVKRCSNQIEYLIFFLNCDKNSNDCSKTSHRKRMKREKDRTVQEEQRTFNPGFKHKDWHLRKCLVLKKTQKIAKIVEFEKIVEISKK